MYEEHALIIVIKNIVRALKIKKMQLLEERKKKKNLRITFNDYSLQNRAVMGMKRI